MIKSRVQQVSLFTNGVLQVFLHIFIVSVLCMWALQAIAMGHGETYDWNAVLQHLVLSLSFLAFFPGQTVWTYQVEDRAGRVMTIVGRAHD